tara:strand:- start:2174 stop:3205 length:1032 start_codon:yes stop_codon:yes gene_type:complete
MIFKEILILPQSYKLATQFSSSINHASRASWIIQITDINNFTGYGEASPLPEFNSETFEMAGYALEGFKLAISNSSEDFEIEELMILIGAHTYDAPSACFALQTAIYDILSQQKYMSLSKYLNPNASTHLEINGLYQITSNKNYKFIKLKCGFRNLYDELELIEKLTDQYESEVNFILDLNQNYDLSQAIRFLKEVSKFNIAYVEQPLKKDKFEDLAELRFHSKIPIALDESVSDLDTINDILYHNIADIIIIKPQSIGSFDKIKKAITLIREAEKQVTITSSLEGKIGRFASMHLAAANQIESPCGLALEKIFLHENSEFPLICNGKISVPQQHGLGCQEYK